MLESLCNLNTRYIFLLAVGIRYGKSLSHSLEFDPNRNDLDSRKSYENRQ